MHPFAEPSTTRHSTYIYIYILWALVHIHKCDLIDWNGVAKGAAHVILIQKNKPNILNVIAMEKFCSFRHVAMLIFSHASWAYDKRCVACANISSICMFMELNGIGWNCNDIFIRFNLFVYQKNDIVELAGWRTMCVSWQVDLINQSINMALTKKKKARHTKRTTDDGVVSLQSYQWIN